VIAESVYRKQQIAVHLRRCGGQFRSSDRSGPSAKLIGEKAGCRCARPIRLSGGKALCRFALFAPLFNTASPMTKGAFRA
jgi:hypothetical protein